LSRSTGRRRAISVTSARSFAASTPALRITSTTMSSRNISSSVGSATIFQPGIAISSLQHGLKIASNLGRFMATDDYFSGATARRTVVPLSAAIVCEADRF
jgi:hypothetical protein